MDYQTDSVLVSLLMVVGSGAVGAAIGSAYGLHRETVRIERSPYPYIGFIIGAVVGMAAAIMWQL